MCGLEYKERENMYSVKLSQIPLQIAGEAGQQLAIKIKYVRAGDPTSEAPLKGLFNYVPFTDSLKNFLKAIPVDSPLIQMETDQLISALKTILNDQGIKQGKFKVIRKFSKSEKKEKFSFSKTENERTVQFRSEQSAENVVINHKGFLKTHNTERDGNSVENLRSLLKLECPIDNENNNALEQALQSPLFSQKVEGILRDGLKNKLVLELVNDAIKAFVNEVLKEH